ncbi:TolC family outer membrane protein [Undibacterium sp. RTI2.1]|uniref:TolC family outer membrane protein n=1 Tax=unclassified Undibacterium TaxID=2630295 RepID=UPI002AB36106|nr:MULTISPECIES: TolC family outer membrane protein [unclassified Undibacterium]MDY7540373.1 TolC family outer membrane protein [Undibacterium sp. 5I1]MEB0029981.1 TolC family outer membrane protein [Undibacterium sp. RTI2.1]MEB0117055.1 TolC family outer membrane protein [Undibacterium sp. RTI2.2]MEB0230005.1 TolC family outer membrane protein [Undibacterium sp. 10I3]MEB0258025.1 TolC family outer membrane protein [Undibacterium sp. 5I1]
MRNPIIATLIAGVFLTLDASAADLLQIYKDALANDAQYSSARASQVAGLEKVVQGRAGLLPSVALSGSDVRTTAEIQPDAPFTSKGTGYTNTYSLALSQPLFRWANWQQYEQGKLLVVASDAQFAQAQQDLIVRVGQAYFDVLTSQDALETLQAQKAAISEQLASAKRNFEVGTSTITDTHEAQARYDLTVAQEFAGISDLQIKRAALQQIIGKEAGDLAILKRGIQISSPQPAQIGDWVSSAEKQNYGVVASQVSLEIARRDISRNRAGHYPTLDLVASSGRNSNGGNSSLNGNGVVKSNSIGVQWNIPLFSGFAVDSRVRESIALEDKARSDLDFTRRTAAQNARQAFLGVTSGLAQVKAYEAAEISSQSALDSNKLGYQVGVRINIDVLNAQQQLYTTRQNLAKARYDTIMNGLRLKSAAGTLKEADLIEVNDLLLH